MAKTKQYTATKTVESIPPEKRWAVISADTGRRIYIASADGIDRDEAERQGSSLLAKTRIVPESALDSFGALDESLLEEAIEEAIAVAEE